jgi:cell division septation protein DedD
MTDIYQSPGDRLRFEILLKSLTEGSINLAVLSDHDMVLDYYGSLFEERLRAKGESHIEWCSSTNSEKLVQKFNEILSEITLDQALEKDKKHAPRRFLLFRDSILMQDFELQLLARLVNGFPAGNISVILMINSAGTYQSKVDAFGKNLLKWEVETEAGEAKQKLTDWVATEPEPSVVQIEPTFHIDPPTLDEEVTPVSKLLNLPTKTAWRVPGFGKKQEPQMDAVPLPAFVPTPPEPVAATVPSAMAPTAPTAMPDGSREPGLGVSMPLAAAATNSTADADLFKRPPRKSYAGWMLLVLLMSMAAFGAMYKDLVLQEAESLKKYVLRGTPAVPAADEAASAAAAVEAASAASAQALAAAELAASVANDAARVASQAEAVASAASAAASATVANPVVLVPAVTASADTSDKKKSDKESKVDKAEAKQDVKSDTKPEANSDEAWVNQLPADAYVVQLAAMDTQEEMRSFQRSNAVYAKSRIMRARHKDTGKRYFILVAGPFETKAKADAFMQSSPLLNKGWLRSSKSMKTQFTKP